MSKSEVVKPLLIEEDEDIVERKKVTPQQLLSKMCNNYISSLHKVPDNSTSKYETPELEVKFGTKGYKQLTKMDYDNVIKKLIQKVINVIIHQVYIV